VDRWIFSAGVYEKGTIELIRLACTHGYSFVDVGASLGSHVVAACLARAEGTQKFVAVEPAPAALEILRHNLRRNHLDAVVEVLPFALSDREEVVPFYVTNGNNPGMNGLARTEPDQLCVPVRARRLDDVMALSAPAKLLVKIDVEGLEPRVLDGSSRLLESCAGLILIIEHAPENLARAGFDRTAVTMRLEARGFEFWKIDEDTSCLARLEPTRDGFCNFVAVREFPSCWRPYLRN
jgi:FkbM family methyltransferase